MRIGLGLAPAGVAVRRLLAAGPPVMPGAATVALYAQDALGRYNVVPNRAETAPLPSSLWGNPRPGLNPLMEKLLQIGGGFTRDGVGADGKALALRLTWGAGETPTHFLMGLQNNNSFFGPRRLPAGTYTLSFDHRSANGAAQAARFLNEAGIGDGPDFAVPADGTWRTYSWTFTIGSEGILRNTLRFPTATTAGDVLLDNFRLVPGSAAGAVPPGDRHIVRVGAFPRSGQAIHTTAGGSEGAEGHAWAAARTDSSTVSLSAMSFAVAVNMEGVASDQVARLIFGDGFQILHSAGDFQMYSTAGGMTLAGCAGPDKAGWVTLIGRGDATGAQVFIDGVMVGSTATPFGGDVRLWQLFHGGYIAGFPSALASAHIYERRLSDAEVGDAHAAMAAQIAAVGGTYAPPAQAMIAEGDSQTAGNSYIPIYARLFTRRLQVRNFGVVAATFGVPSQVGTGVNTLWGRAHLVAAQIAHAKSLGRQPVLTMLSVTNDRDKWNGAPAGVAFAAAHEEYWTYMRARGAKVVDATSTAYQGISASEQAGMDAFNQSLRDRYAAGKLDGLADYAASRVGTWNSGDYLDDVHLSPAGRAVLAPILRDAVAPLVPDRV